MSSPEWMARAACGPEDDMLFYPPEGLPQTDKDLLRARALRVCADCPVQDQCYDQGDQVYDRLHQRAAIQGV